MSDREELNPIYSRFAEDDDMAELVDMFVNELPTRVDAVRRALREREWGRLRTIAHQLKGAAPGYGFEAIGSAAHEVEIQTDVKMGTRELHEAVEQLIMLCRRAARTEHGHH